MCVRGTNGGAFRWVPWLLVDSAKQTWRLRSRHRSDSADMDALGSLFWQLGRFSLKCSHVTSIEAAVTENISSSVLFFYFNAGLTLLTFLCLVYVLLQTQYNGNARKAIMEPIAVSLSTLNDDIATDNEPTPEDFIFSAGDLDDQEDDAVEDSIPTRFLSAQRIQELRVKHRRHETDTGSPEYQVAGMTERINHLTNHLKEHPKDFSTRRGLVALVNKRRRLLNYLYKEDEKRYVEIVGALGIRHKVPGSIPSREEQYGRFPPQKASKGKSKTKKASN